MPTVRKHLWKVGSLSSWPAIKYIQYPTCGLSNCIFPLARLAYAITSTHVMMNIHFVRQIAACCCGKDVCIKKSFIIFYVYCELEELCVIFCKFTLMFGETIIKINFHSAFQQAVEMHLPWKRWKDIILLRFALQCGALERPGKGKQKRVKHSGVSFVRTLPRNASPNCQTLAVVFLVFN